MGFSLIRFIRSQLFTSIPVPETSFAGQTVIVTGSNVGLGKEAARHIVRLGAAKVIIAVRNVKAGADAAAEIHASTGRQNVCDVWQLDLGSFESVKAFAAKANALPRLDAVLENAGLATATFEKLPEAGGHERTIAVNVVSTFLLAFLLLPKLRETGAKTASEGSLPRLTIVASDAHAMTTFEERKFDPIFEALSNKDKAIMADRYPVSKLLEIMVIRQSAPLLGSQENTPVVFNCVTPGLCYSDLTREMGLFQKVGMRTMQLLLARSTEIGGRTLVDAVSGGRKTHGKFMEDCAPTEPDEGLVRSEDGVKTSQRVWKELQDILEKIEPGVTKNLKA